MAFTPIDEEEIIDEPVAEEAKPRFIPIEDDEFFGIGGEAEATESVVAPEVAEPVEAPKSRFTPISEEEFFGLPEPTEPIPVTGEEGFLRQAADVPLKIGESINTSLRALTDLFGADNAVSQNLTQNSEWYRSLLSAQALEDEQEIGRILKEAEDKDMLYQLAAGLEAFSVAPVDFVASGVGSLAVFAATGVLGRAAAVAGAARAGLTGAKAAQFVQRGVKATQIATGAGLGAGIVKGEIYQSVKDEMLARGKTEEEAKAIAMEAQSYGGKNLDQILIGAGLGTIDAFTGAEKILGKVLTKGGLAPNASRIGNILKSGITEAVPEFVQAAQEKFASNLALRREGVDVSLTQGVFSQGALEGLVGLGLGVGTGAIEPRIQTEPTKEEVSAAAAETQDVARQSMDVAPATASLVEGEAEQIIQSQAETPDEKVARLQREAQEAAGEIELEEELPVSGLPPVEPTPPVTPTPEAAVAPVEPVVPVEGVLPPAIEEVAPEERENIVALPPAETLPETPTPEGQRWDTTPPSATLPKELENRNNIVNKLPELTTREAVWLDLSLHEVSNSLAEKSKTRKNWVDDLKENSRRKQPFLDSLQTGEPMTNEQAQEALAVIRESKQIHSDYATGKYRGSTARGNQQWHNAWLNKYNEIEAELINNYPALAAPEAAPVTQTPTEVAPTPTPEEPPALAPLRRVVKAEQTEDDVSGLVGQGLVELYNGQPVITQAGLETLPEAERPRLTPEARKIQIDTRTSEAAAEAISKNLRIGVDQVPVDVRMPAGWTLEGDIYIPPQPQVAPATAPTTPQLATKEAAPTLEQFKETKSNYWVPKKARKEFDVDYRTGKSIDVKKAWEQVMKNRPQPIKLTKEYLRAHIEFRELKEESLKRANINHLGLAVFEVNPMLPDYVGVRLIDGWHRAAKALEEGKDFWVYPVEAENSTIENAYKWGTKQNGLPQIAPPVVEAAPEFAFAQEVEAKKQNIKTNMIRFASGMSGISDLRAGAYTRAGFKNYGVGFDVGLLSKNAIEELADFIINMDTQAFIDSGAFSNFRKSLKAQEGGKTVEALNFDKIFEKYDAILDAIQRINVAERTDYPRPMIVMPDIIGDQNASLDLIDQYKNRVSLEVSSNTSIPIIPIPLGELSLSEAYNRIIEILKTNTIGSEINPENFVVGIPSNAKAVSKEDLAKFLRESKPPRIHFLGAAADRNISPLIDIVSQNSPETQVTADASKVRSAILSGVAKGKTRKQAIFDALYQEDDPEVVLNAATVPQPEARESRRAIVTPQQDRDYLDAVERGDSGNDNLSILLRASKAEDRPSVYQQWAERNPKSAAAIQKAVDDAAKKAGYYPKKLYHGTPDGRFYEFDVSSLRGVHELSVGTRPVFLTTSENVADEFRGGIWVMRSGMNDKYVIGKDEGEIVKAYPKHSEVKALYAKFDNLDIYDFFGGAYNEETVTGLLKSAKKSKKGGVVFRSMADGSYTTTGRMPVSNIVAIFNPNNIKSADPVTYDDQGNPIPLSQRFQQGEADIRYSYAGVRAQTPQFMRDSLSVAQAMAAKGEDAETIRSVTGWIVNPYDGKLRWEIPDNEAKFVSSSVFANAAKAIYGGDTAEQLVGKLGDILDHKQLFDAYPDLKNIDVLMADLRGANAEYRPASKTFSLPEQITISYRSDPQQVKSSILHEIQHAIQNREEFARGASPETAKNEKDTQIAAQMALGIKSWMRDPASKNLSIDEIQRTTSDPTRKDLWPLAQQLVARSDKDLKTLASKRVIGREGYRRVAGEIEARDVQARMAMTPEQRKAAAPYSSENISPEDAIVMGGEGGVAALRPTGMTTDAVRARLEALGFGVEGMIRIVEDPQAAFEGRTIIQDGKAVRIELNASALNDDAAIDRVLNHEFAEAANADGALNKLVERLTPKEKKEINDAITRLGYEERVRTTEEAARAIETLAAGWKGRGFFERAVARVEAWGSKLGLKLTRRAAEYIAARNLSDINAGFKAAYNRFINVRGEAREGRAFVTPEENARFLELAKDPEANREKLQRMVDEAARAAGYTFGPVWHGTRKEFTRFFNQPTYFSESEQFARYTVAGKQGRVIKAFLRGNLFDPRNPEHIAQVGEMERLYGKMPKNPTYQYFHAAVQNWLQENGWGGHYEQESTQSKSRSLVVFEPMADAKSADPVTYDDQGNVIPLDQRFQPATADIRYSRTEIRESRRSPAPTFTEESPEAKTLSNLKASMDKVDSASEAKGGKPETQKVSEIAANWMESGGDERALQDAITENTNLSPANAAKVAKVIAKQYGLQQQIAETGAVIAEIAPEAEGAPRKSSVAKLIEQTTGVRKPVVKLQVSESAALKKQIQLKAREARETRKARKEAAEDLAKSITDYVKANPIRGPINSRQAMSITKKALKLDVNNEAAVDRFEMYVERVIENANYDRDLADARALIKKVKAFAKAKGTQGNVKTTLDAIANISPTLLDNPFEFNLVVQRYLLGLAPVTAKQYAVMPDADVRRYLESLETQIKDNQEVLDRSKAQRILDKQAAYANEKGIPLDEAIAILNSEEFLEEKTIEKLEDLTKLLTSMAQESQKDVKAYDETGATPKQKELISFMRKVSLDSLTNEEKKRYIRFSNNLLANGATFGMEQFQSIALGQEAAMKAVKDRRLSDKLAAWISPIGGDKAIDTARKIALRTQSEADTFKNIFGRDAVGAFRNILGLNRLDLAQTASNNAKEQIANETGEYYKGLKKKYGEDATNFEAKGYAGVAGYLIQAEGNKTEVESIAYRRRLMEQSIAELRKSDMQSDQAEADLKERALAQLTGTSNAEVLSQLKAINPASYEQLIWWKDTMLPKWRDFLKEHDENFRNQANNYNNPDHLTITYKFPEGQLLPNEIKDVYQQDMVGMRIKQAANSIKRKEHANLPVSKTGTVANIDINFGYNQYNALVDQVDKAFVAPAWEQVVAFTNDQNFEQIMGGRANALFVKKLLTDIQTSRTRQSMSDDDAQVVAGGVRLARKMSTQAVLGGFTQPLRQVPDQLSKLFFTTGRFDLITKNLLKIAEASPLMNKFPIGRRGDAQAGTQYASQFSELARKVEASVTDRKWAKYRELMNKVGEFWMTPLRGSDVWAAKVSWMTYYEADLNKKGIKMESWEREAELVDTDQARKDAAAYAEWAVDFYGGASDPTKMAALSRQTNNGWKEFAKLMFLPLNSFALQQKNSLISDMRDIFLRTGDRKESIAAVAGTLAGMAAFHATRIYIIGGLIYPAGKALLMGIFGIDMDEPDEEEKQKQLEDNWRKFKGSMYGNIVAGGLGQFVENNMIDAFNRTAYLWDANINPDSLLNDKGEIMSFRQYEKDVSPLYRFRSYGSSEYTFGLADVLTEQATHAWAETQQLLTQEEMERYTGNEQAYAAFATGVEWMYFFRLMDTDLKRIATSLKRDMDKGVEEREAEIRAIRNR